MQRRTSDFAENVPLLICFIGPDGRITDANSYFVQATGFSKDELTGMQVFDIVTQRAGTIKETIATIISSRQASVKEIDVLVRRKDGTEFPGILAASALPQQDNSSSESKVIGVAVTESSQLARAKEEAEAANKELRRKESLKDEFIAIASHELRTPIQPILGLALLAKKGQISQEEAWDSVLKEARRLTQLANDILDVSRIENGTLRYNFARANVSEIIEYVVNALRTSELGKDIDFSIVMDESARAAYCDLDRQRITQVLMNVIGNAAKFTIKGRVNIEARADVKNSRYDIMVSDTGGGIPEAVLPHMFKKFITKSVGEGEKHGSGLGLFISRAIIAAHNGAIYLYNNDENGATFVIRLPFEQPAARRALSSPPPGG
ncbi:PAS domain S-box [Candidatus Nitrososphaera evergladensis SR1]|uniref:histidine kinase n=1 Tax=Candidatus Nitrososphaera evergladensis SR1 TaxID=1459636 RepID=A0A075MTN0_9ARCH|nr:PAS domain-containing sensor histidine kinase [Candidatus Nitrososphaera evergladensis]AIF84976.1 PAS domain S-box [Candidatus Nitrososphaera evergladensis SR1]